MDGTTGQTEKVRYEIELVNSPNNGSAIDSVIASVEGMMQGVGDQVKSIASDAQNEIGKIRQDANRARVESESYASARSEVASISRPDRSSTSAEIAELRERAQAWELERTAVELVSEEYTQLGSELLVLRGEMETLGKVEDSMLERMRRFVTATKEAEMVVSQGTGEWADQIPVLQQVGKEMEELIARQEKLRERSVPKKDVITVKEDGRAFDQDGYQVIQNEEQWNRYLETRNALNKEIHGYEEAITKEVEKQVYASEMQKEVIEALVIGDTKRFDQLQAQLKAMQSQEQAAKAIQGMEQVALKTEEERLRVERQITEEIKTQADGGSTGPNRTMRGGGGSDSLMDSVMGRYMTSPGSKRSIGDMTDDRYFRPEMVGPMPRSSGGMAGPDMDGLDRVGQRLQQMFTEAADRGAMSWSQRIGQTTTSISEAMQGGISRAFSSSFVSGRGPIASGLQMLGNSGAAQGLVGGAGQAVGSGAGGVIGGWIGGQIGGDAGALSGSLAGSQIGLQIGDAFIQQVLPRLATGAGAGGVALAGSAAAAIAGVGFAAKIATEQITGYADKQGSWSMTIAETEAKWASSIDSMTGGVLSSLAGSLEGTTLTSTTLGAAFVEVFSEAKNLSESFKAVERAQKSLAENQAKNSYNRAVNDIEFDESQARRGLDSESAAQSRKMALATTELKGEQLIQLKLKLGSEEEKEVREKMSELKKAIESGDLSDGREQKAKAELVASERHLMSILEQRGRLGVQLGQEQQKAHDKEIAGIEKEIKAQETLIEKERQKAEHAVKALRGLSDRDRWLTEDARDQAQKSGFGSLGTKDQERIRKVNSDLADQLDSKDPKAVAQKQRDLQRWSSNQPKVASAEKTLSNLRVKLDNVKADVNFKVDSDHIVRSVEKAMGPLMSEVRRVVTQTIEEKSKQGKSQAMAAFNAQMEQIRHPQDTAQRRAAHGGNG